MSTHHLRVALIQAGRIVEDRTFPPSKGNITVGSAEDCTFLVPLADVPTRATVFEQNKHGVTLHFRRDADGRVSLGDGDRSFDSLAATAAQKGDGFTVGLNTKARGRIAIGEVSLLFQFVEPTAKPAPTPLPKGAKGLLAQIDRSFLIVLGISLAAHFAGVTWLSSQDVPEERDLQLDEVNLDRWAAAIPMPPRKVKEPETAAPTKTNDDAPPSKQPEVAARPPAKAKPMSKDQIGKLGLAGIIGSKGPGDDGAFGDIIGDTKIGDVAEALRNAGEMRVANAEDAVAGKRQGKDTGETETVEPIGTNGVKEVKLTERMPNAVPPPSEINVNTGPVKSGPEIPEEELSKWLRARKPAIQSCYERELKRQPSLAGHLTIHFDITPRGRAGNVTFDEDTLRSAAVNSCISGLMKGWVLPFQPEDDAPVAWPFIFSATK
ncbi:MAG: AgmX/PglI C-terminal domain-containing protein [Archangium sp.]|nr:AgmX/PglI C-terminal domain-containing protein [Archangium sp.]